MLVVILSNYSVQSLSIIILPFDYYNFFLLAELSKLLMTRNYLRRKKIGAKFYAIFIFETDRERKKKGETRMKSEYFSSCENWR